MPSPNRDKLYIDESYYHIYNRGVDKRRVFMDAEDYAVFINLFKRYLDEEPAKDKLGRPYAHLHDDIELLAFCLMPNHFHLLVYAVHAPAMTVLMKSVTAAYVGYFNKKYKRVGPLFQSRYKASMILDESYLLHISRYIHLNPKAWRSWRYSSLPYYLGEYSAGWMQPRRILDLFEAVSYLEFVSDYEEHKNMLEQVKKELAN